MFKRLLIAIVLLGLIVGGIVWFKYFRDGMIAAYLGSMPAPTVPVTSETVEAVRWEPGIDAVGTSLAVQGVDLAVETGGLVRVIGFAANDDVTLGQTLLQINDDSEVASLAAAQAALRVAQSEAARARTLSDRGVGAINTVESADAQAESARAQVAQVQTALDAKQATAPFAGVIGIPQVEVGQYVSPGTVYATLQDLGQMRVDFAVPEQQIADLRLEGPVTVATDVGDFSATGKIIAIEPRVDPNSRMVSVRAEVGNEGGKLLPGQFLRVRIGLPAEDGVIAVPQTAVSSSLYGDSIYVIRKAEAKEGEAAPAADALVVEQVFVTLGRRSGARIEVVKGIAAGDQIVTSGQNRLNNGTSVKIDNSVDIEAPPAAPLASE